MNEAQARKWPQARRASPSKQKTAGRYDDTLTPLRRRSFRNSPRSLFFVRFRAGTLRLTAKAEYEFTYGSEGSGASQVQMNELVRDSIVVPIVQECGSSVFVINHSTSMGWCIGCLISASLVATSLLWTRFTPRFVRPLRGKACYCETRPHVDGTLAGVGRRGRRDACVPVSAREITCPRFTRSISCARSTAAGSGFFPLRHRARLGLSHRPRRSVRRN